MGDHGRAPEPHRTILDTVPDMVYALDTEFRFRFVNDALVTVTGYDREELLGAHASVVFDERAIAEGQWNRERIRAGDVEFGCLEVELETAAGDRIPCEVRGQTVPEHSHGLGDGTVGVIRNISDRKEREQELQARSAAMKASTDGMAILDEDGTYRFVNQAHADIYGYSSPEEFVGETWRLCYSADELDRFDGTVMPKLRDEGEWRGEAVGTRKDGSTFPQELSLSLTDDGRTICVVRDVTERKRRERELERKTEQLDDFAGVVSHDLRNPLHVAQGRLDLAQEESESEHLDKAADAIDRCFTLIDDLLTLAREGMRVGETDPVDLDNVALDCWQTVETEDATLTVETGRTVRADPNRLRELLENLLRNAVKHGGEDVTVTVDDHDDGFYVADDGSGIPDGKRDRIFEAGYSTADEGTGFGLEIVERIAEAHGWDVRVTESEAGGARFVFTSVNSPE
ncbi:sensor histidine kinase [Halobellus ruber]|uniref:histidine kinase n=1 Tax=Halobellus ruber TaxID=2761102 RepID=A0A7J9SFE0_9EURY|nr:PAS domain-containing sensor histidine kinase [Halobellus ruber]MBB6645438.1 PAS domain S-box protein [Halobellus ruber]